MSSVSPRSSRAPQQRSIDTRTRILDAAVQALISDGYSGATTLRIQQIAGVSRGRLLHHFPFRNQLLIAACNHLSEVRISGLIEKDDWPTDATARIDAAVRAMWGNFQEPVFWASMELWLASRHVPELREALQPTERELSRLNYRAIDLMFGPDLVAHIRYRSLRYLLNTSMRGFALTTSFDPADETARHLDDWSSLARKILDVE